MTKGEQFLAAVRGIPNHHVTKALGSLTPGTDWAGCSKSHMARALDDAERGNYRPRLATIDLALLARRARARADGDQYWSLVGTDKHPGGAR